MNLIRDRYNAISFRGRVLFLLVVVSLVQAIVAAYTFHNLQSKPLKERVNAQLNANVRAMAPVVDNELVKSAAQLEQLATDQQLIDAVASGDYDQATLLLAPSSTETPATDFTTSSATSTAPGVSVAYITDAEDEVIAGTRPDGVLVEKKDVTNAALRRGAELLGTLHVPMVVNEAFMRDRLGEYVSDNVVAFVSDGTTLVTKNGSSEQSGSVLAEGLHTVTVDGKARYALVQPVLDEGVFIGAGVPEGTLGSEQREGMKNLVGFLFALLGLMLIESWVITRKIGDAMRKFAKLARALAGGELHRRIPVTGNDEIAMLGESFNEMAENLEQRIQNLTEARAKMRRQVELFGDALANATSLGEMLQSVCSLAIETTDATHARFWTVDDVGHFQLSACLGLRPTDTEPCGLERSVTVGGATARSEGTPSWLVVPSRSGEQIVGLLTVVHATGEITDDAAHMAERIGVQAAVAIDNARMHEKLREQATRDGLTGLPNHRAMQDALGAMLSDSYRHMMPMGLALLDIDNFKRINDTYGHHIGDEGIKALARVLHHGIGEAGMAARYGGEEFVLLLPGCDSSAACRIADRLREDIARIEVPLGADGVLQFTASFGVADLDQYTSVVDQAELLKHADLGLYKAKRSGKNRVELATPDMVMMQMTAEEHAALEARERGEGSITSLHDAA